MAVEAERFSSTGFSPPWVRHEHIERYLFAAGFVKGRDVVDCACGVGEGTRIFAEAGAKSLRAFDVSADAIAAARQNCRGLANVEIGQADAADLPVPAQSADVFISLETFEHLQDQRAFLKEVARVLRPDGLFVCSTPNRTIYNPGGDLAARPWNRYHVREYATAEFRTILGEFFKDIRLYGQNAKSPRRAQMMQQLGRLIPGHGAVRINQALKLPRFLFGRQSRHAVIPAGMGSLFEYDVAVCAK